MKFKTLKQRTKKLITVFFEHKSNVQFLLGSTKGIALIYVLFFASMVGGFGLWVMRQESVSLSSITQQKVRSEATLIANEVHAILSDPTKCILTFGSATPYKSIVNKYSETSPDVFTATERKYYTMDQAEGKSGYGNSFIKIISYELVKKEPTKEMLFIRFQSKESRLSGPMTSSFARRMILYVERDADDNILKCRTIEESDDEIWIRGEGASIHYNVDAGDGVGIESKLPVSEFHIEGDVFASDDVTADTYYYVSDRDQKESIETIDGPLEKLLSLRGVSFDWIDNEKRDYGFIAQEVFQTIPEIVQRDHEDSLHVDYAKIIPLVVEALKEQQEEIDLLEDELKTLR